MFSIVHFRPCTYIQLDKIPSLGYMLFSVRRPSRRRPPRSGARGAPARIPRAPPPRPMRRPMKPWAVAAPAPSRVTRDSLRAARREGQPVFIRFGTPWCGHSAAMGPDWEKLKAQHPGVVRDVDCTDESELCRELGVTSFPTIRLFEGEAASEYRGPRTQADMSRWLTSRLSVDRSSRVASLSEGELKAVLKSNKPRFVRFTAPWCGHSRAMTPLWEALAAEFPGVIADVDCSTHPSVCEEESVRGLPTLKLFTNGSSELYTGPRAHAPISAWLAHNLKRRPRSAPGRASSDSVASKVSSSAKLTHADFKAIRESGRPAFIRFGAPWCGHSKAMTPEWERMKAGYPEVVKEVDCTVEQDLCTEANVKGFPTLVLFNRNESHEYQGARTKAAMAPWLDQHLRS